MSGHSLESRCLNVFRTILKRKNEPYKYLLSNARGRAKKRNLPFTLTLEWSEKHYTGKCSLTGIPFKNNSIGASCYSPSIDRIIPELGYIPDNCRFILHGINTLKNKGSDKDVYRIAQALIDTRSQD